MYQQAQKGRKSALAYSDSYSLTFLCLTVRQSCTALLRFQHLGQQGGGNLGHGDNLDRFPFFGSSTERVMKPTFRGWISGIEESLDISSAVISRLSPVRSKL